MVQVSQNGSKVTNATPAKPSASEEAESAEEMCGEILDKLKDTRDEMRADKWSIERSINLMILRHLFTMNGSQMKMIVESLNFLGMMVPSKSAAAKAVVDQMVSIQVQKGHLNLLDFNVTLKDILQPEYFSWLNTLMDNCRSVFGSDPEDIKFQPVDLVEIDGTFDSQFSSSLCLTSNQPPLAILPVATSSTTDSQGNSRAEMMARVTKTHPSFAEKLQQFGN